MMRHHRWAAAALAGVALTVTACGTGSGSTGGGAYGNQSMPASSAPAQTTALKTEVTRVGTVLASGGGLTLYYYSEDKPGSGKSACTGSCAATWPPLAAPVRAPAGVHLPGPIGYIVRPSGFKQVTINGYPVYKYAGDKAPGQATGNGIEGAWHVIKIA